MNRNKIVFVEDHPPQKQMITALLENNCLTVFLVADRVKPLDTIKVQRSDLVIFDIVMPQMNGYGVCRRSKNDLNTKDFSVVICSNKQKKLARPMGSKNTAYGDNKPFNSIYFFDKFSCLNLTLN